MSDQNAPAALVAAGLRKGYQEGDGSVRHDVLVDLGLELRAGTVCAIIGKSGAGKSTLLNVLCGIDRPDNGTVHVAGTDLGSLSEEARTRFRRAHIGFVFQFFNLLPTLTVLENVLLPLELNGKRGPAARAEARGWLERVGVGRLEARFPDALSGGEQQRVALARALVHGPRVVLADEPTGNLDSETGSAVLRELVALARAHDVTVVMVTHSADVAAAADLTLRLEGGRLVTVRSGAA